MTATNNRDKLTKTENNQSIYRCVKDAIEVYFEDMDGHDPEDLYDLFLSQAEKPMIEVVLQQTQRNMTRSSKILGMNRATLRKKIKKYGL